MHNFSHTKIGVCICSIWICTKVVLFGQEWMTLKIEAFENIVRKAEYAGGQDFFLFSQYIPLNYR